MIRKGFPLLSWDIYSSHSAHLAFKAKKEKDVRVLRRFCSKFKWNVSIDEVLSRPYQALVLTDLNQNILWVNQGFTEMTGYPRVFAVGKKPFFLQGEKTSPQTKQNIREHLSQGLSFEGTIVNYKKNTEEYLCQVKIVLLYNHENRLTHYLALENITVA